MKHPLVTAAAVLMLAGCSAPVTAVSDASSPAAAQSADVTVKEKKNALLAEHQAQAWRLFPSLNEDVSAVCGSVQDVRYLLEHAGTGLVLFADPDETASDVTAALLSKVNDGSSAILVIPCTQDDEAVSELLCKRAPQLMEADGSVLLPAVLFLRQGDCAGAVSAGRFKEGTAVDEAGLERALEAVSDQPASDHA